MPETGAPAHVPSGHQPQTSIRTAVIASVALSASFVGFGATIAAVPRHVERLGYVDNRGMVIGVATALFPITALAGRLFSGRLIDRVGGRPVLIAGAALTALGSALLAAPGLAGLFAARLLQGIGDGVLYTAAASVTIASVPAERRGQALNWLSTGIWIGLSAGAAIAPLFASIATLGWLFAAVAVLAVIAALTLPRTPRQTDQPARRGRMVEREAIRPAAVVGLTNLGYAAITGYSIILAEGRFDHGNWVLAAFGVGLLLARGVFGSLADRLTLRSGLQYGHALLTVGVVTIAVSSTLWMAITGAVIAAVGHSLPFPLLVPATIDRVGPERQGAVVATVTAGFDIAVAAAYGIFGAVVDAYNPTTVFVLAAGGVVLAHLVSRPLFGATATPAIPSVP